MYSVIIFDVDGVLLDSLESHLAFCRKKSEEYGLHLSIPDRSEFKKLAQRGVVISPMENFLRAVGFPPHLADLANQDYQREFARSYHPELFAGAADAINRLKKAGLRLGLLTSNVWSNIRTPLSDCLPAFDRYLVLTKEDPAYQDKKGGLHLLVERAQVSPDAVIYVGDQPADQEAAETNGIKFLAVTYGWGFDSALPSSQWHVDEPGQMESCLREMMTHA